MSISAENRLATALTVLAVLGLLAVMQALTPQRNPEGSPEAFYGVERHAAPPQLFMPDGRMVEYR